MKRPICKITLIYTSTLVEGEHIENNFNLESTTYKTFLSDNFILALLIECFIISSMHIKCLDLPMMIIKIINNRLLK